MNDLLHFFTPWEPSYVVAIVIIIAAVFCRPRHRMYLWLGLVIFYVTLETQFDYYSEHEFFMHRIQHSLLHHLAPFLIALGKPREITFPGKKLLNNLAVAPILFCGLIIFWLIPPVHLIAMLDWRWYRVMNWSMVINGLMFWNLALNGNFAASRRIIIMLAVIPPQIIIGMLIFIAPNEIYPLYSLCGRAFSLSALADQQIGGLVLWIQAAMMSGIGVLVVLQREYLKK